MASVSALLRVATDFFAITSPRPCPRWGRWKGLPPLATRATARLECQAHDVDASSAGALAASPSDAVGALEASPSDAVGAASSMDSPLMVAPPLAGLQVAADA